MAEKVTVLRRELTRSDMERMRIPLRYWKVSFEKIPADVSRNNPDAGSAQTQARSYIEKMEEMADDGVGLLLWGSNGRGKTSMAVVIAKEYRRRGRSVLFVEAAALKQYVINGVFFDGDEGESYWDRAMSVDVLVIDDFGKGTQDRTGFGMRLFDELVRHRNAEKLVTFITTNMCPRDQLSELLLDSTIHSLKECVIPLEIIGDDQRDAVKVEIENRLKN